MVKLSEEEYLAHYGILRRSGRYPWGSGDNQNQSNKRFLDWVEGLRKEGYSEVEIARGAGISTGQLRAAKTIAKNEQKATQIAFAQRLKDKQYSNVAAAERMGIPESTFRTLIAPGAADKADALTKTANMLKEQVDSKKYLDIGTGVETQIGISDTRLKAAVALLKEEDYNVYQVKVPQAANPKQNTTIRTLTPPEVTYSELYANRDNIKQITDFSDDDGRNWSSAKPPTPIDPKRVDVKYGSEGGSEADGVIYIRPGVNDVNLGGSRYAQVRVQVGDDHYLKGMAMYKDDLPPGVDLQFNTVKESTGNKLDALKEVTGDPLNPFGSTIKPNGQRGVMNIVNEEGDWNDWSRNLSSQMLSKQSPSLATSQLNMTYEKRQKELDEILALTNPVVRRKLLETFADSTDSAAVHLKAHQLPRQRNQVILPLDKISENEIYAPNFRDGERVVLIRHPHGGTFEIPQLVVNNQNPQGKKLLGQAQDAVGIHHKVAEHLSGADFDGDHVLVIPNNQNRVKLTPALEQLKGFDPIAAYPGYEGMKPMTSRTKGIQMGEVSNLITDMTIKKASHAELARAVKHSMVVIDAEKKNLNYKLSAKQNGIPALKEKYQGKARGGADTLISKAGSTERVATRKPRPMAEGGPIDKKTGKRVYVDKNESYVSKKTGKVINKTEEVKRLANTDDARTLLSGDGTGTQMERVYAEHSNKLKALANQARLEQVNTPRLEWSPSAKQVYKKEVDELNSHLALAKKNRPLERQAQVFAQAVVKQKKTDNPSMDEDTLKKVTTRAITEARARTGAEKYRIEITPPQWDAIQAGALSDSRLSEILTVADLDTVRKLATPKQEYLMTTAKIQRAQSMAASGYTRAQIADQLGVSLSTLEKEL